MVKVGQTVNWLNSDTVIHSATDPGVFDTGNIAPTSAHSANGDGSRSTLSVRTAITARST